ncbi:sigma-70 family RNA polymerase sigma factor [Ilumatobacter sp.]|uniref:sigma-70 family RNA polymerase sigma factor n=1 Tax=Ilumatobacter sp. TaxID=1967498 RepID=UPI003C6807D9
MSTPTRTLRPEDLDVHRRALTGYCYRMLGSGAEAEDAVQETMVKAWHAADGFEGRSSVRTWLFRIANNVCIDMGRSPQRRARPMDLGPARTPDPVHLSDVLPENTWITPIADERVIDVHGDPAQVVAMRDTIRLAFVSTLQHLPARQRAALVLCDVLRWPATEVAELLDTSTASVNSSLQRARATMADSAAAPASAEALTDEQQRLLTRYVEAFERYDMDALSRLLHDDVIQTMPPYAMWLHGRDDVLAWWVGPGAECAGSKLLNGWANGCPAFAQYRVDPEGGHAPWALQVLELRGDRVAEFHAFLDTEAFERFGFPAHL